MKDSPIVEPIQWGTELFGVSWVKLHSSLFTYGGRDHIERDRQPHPLYRVSRTELFDSIPTSNHQICEPRMADTDILAPFPL